jgi:hypothetical protein
LDADRPLEALLSPASDISRFRAAALTYWEVFSSPLFRRDPKLSRKKRMRAKQASNRHRRKYYPKQQGRVRLTRSG